MLKKNQMFFYLVFAAVNIQQAFAVESNSVQYKFQYFRDNNLVRVLTNSALFTIRLSEKVTLKGNYLVDATTGASRQAFTKNNKILSDDIRNIVSRSVDATTAASPKMPEIRNQEEATVVYTTDFFKNIKKDNNSDNPTALSISGIHGHEPDYTSKTFSVALAQDLFQRNTSLLLRIKKSFDQYHPIEQYRPGSNDDGWNYFGNGKRKTDNITVSITQGLTVKTIGSLNFGYMSDRGYLARPYYVYEIDDIENSNDSLSDPVTKIFYHETVPPKRESIALAGKIVQYVAVGNGAAIHLGYRYYTDSWDIESHAIETELHVRLDENFLIRPSYRFYKQSRAFFFEDRYYDANRKYLTVDLKHGNFSSSSIGLKLSWELHDFFKNQEVQFFHIVPVAFDISGDMYFKNSKEDEDIIRSYYSFHDAGEVYKHYSLQTGVKFAF